MLFSFKRSLTSGIEVDFICKQVDIQFMIGVFTFWRIFLKHRHQSSGMNYDIHKQAGKKKEKKKR